MKVKKDIIPSLIILFVVFSLGVFSSYLILGKNKVKVLSIQNKKNIHLEFLNEIYNSIQKNYWEKLTDDQLTELFKTAAENLTVLPQSMQVIDKGEVFKMIEDTLSKMENNDQKKEFVTKLADMALANLKPFGRSRLYTKKEEKDLRNRVNNVNPEKDLYKIIGVERNASGEALQKAYQEKVAKLGKEEATNPQAKEELKNIEYVYKVLSNKENKQVYDQVGAEPTVFGRLITPDIAYLRIKQISPITFEEFQKTVNNLGIKENPSSLILDIRGNIGGSVDLLVYFLGPFIGQNQYAYDFFHQGEYQPFKTRVGWLPSLVKYNKVVILIDENTHSSAEVMSAALKKYNVGVLVGTHTKGWGTIENVFPIETQFNEHEKYSIFLVHSLTLRDDNQPIEGKGVDPTIDIALSDWEKKLESRFNYPELVREVKTVLAATQE